MNDRSRWIALVVLCTGMLMIVLDMTIVNVALPTIQADLGFSQAGLAWVVNAYLIAFAGLLLSFSAAAQPFNKIYNTVDKWDFAISLCVNSDGGYTELGFSGFQPNSVRRPLRARWLRPLSRWFRTCLGSDWRT